MRKIFSFVLLSSAVLLSSCIFQGPQGPQGPKGDQGEQGLKGETGENGTNGTNGQDGKDGTDGHTPVLTIGDDGYWYVDGVKTNQLAQGPKGDSGSQGVDFSKYEGKTFYYFDYEDEEYDGKIIRCGFDRVEEKEYIVEGEQEHQRLMGYDWFVPELQISEGNIKWAWNSGYLTIPSYDPYQITLNWGVEVYDNEFNEIQPGRYFDEDFYEIIFGDDVIIWYQELNDEYIFKLYYSEEFLEEKGVEFYDLDEVIDLTQLTQI